jgi:hypothetical protein
VIRRIDPVGRIAYGVLCIAAMAALAAPLLVVIGTAAGVFFAINGDVSKGITVGLLSWACAVFAAALLLAIFYTMWPLASDWVTEWGGYALGFAIAGVGLAIMALLVFLVPMALALAVILPLAATFVTGFAVAGKLAGLGSPAAQPHYPAKALRKR